MKENTLIDLKQECLGILIPSGKSSVIKSGDTIEVIRNSGDVVTARILSSYELVRIDAENMLLLGLEPKIYSNTNNITEVNPLVINEILSTIYDPEISINILDLGLIYRCDIKRSNAKYSIEIDMTMTAPGCGMGDILRQDIIRKISNIRCVDEVIVNIVFEPQWNKSMMSYAARLSLGLL